MMTPLVTWLACRIGAVDHPGIRSVHTRPIPRLGGVAIYLSAACVILGLFFLNHASSDWFRERRLQIITLLGSATGIFLIGLLDDLRGMRARWKFLAELLGAGILCLAGVQISSIPLGGGSQISLGWLGLPLTILWIVGLTNAVNMSDGLDGLAAGVTAIACAVIAVFALYSSTLLSGAARDNAVMIALFSLTMLGSICGFLFFNFNPAKVFMGDSGSLFIGFSVASLSVMSLSRSATIVPLALPALALGIPIFDMVFSMLRRFLDRRSLFAPDRSHFHHRLLEFGFNQRQAVMVIYAVTLLAAGLGLVMLIANPLLALTVFTAALVLIVFLFHVVGAIRLRETLECLRSRYECWHHHREEQRTFEDLQLCFRQVRSDSAWWPALCDAARRMDFAWISLKTAHSDGRIDTEIWRNPDDSPSDLPRLITMAIPFRNGDSDCRRELEVAINVNGSYESASHRGTLFGRLLDASELIGRQPQAQMRQSESKSPEAMTLRRYERRRVTGPGRQAAASTPDNR